MSIANIHDVDQSYASLCKNPDKHGCGKEKCPCEGQWVNCPYYIDITEQQLRIKFKDPEKENEINEWYETYFRFKGQFHDLYCSA